MIFVLILGCAGKLAINSTSKQMAEISINCADSTFYDTQAIASEITIKVANKGNVEFAIANSQRVASCEPGAYFWSAEIIFQDSQCYYFADNFFDKAEMPTGDDYISLMPSSDFVIRFKIPFNELFKDLRDFGKKNKFYGKYLIRVIYSDRYLCVRKALKGKHTSNEIIINYVK